MEKCYFRAPVKLFFFKKTKEILKGGKMKKVEEKKREMEKCCVYALAKSNPAMSRPFWSLGYLIRR